MPPRRNKEKFQLMEFKRGRIIGLREGGFSYRAIGARVQWNRSTVMRAWKQWTDEHRTTRKLAVDDGRCTNVGFVNSSTLAAPWITCKGAFISSSRQTVDGYVYNELMSTRPDMLIGTKLSFLMNYASIYGIMMAAFVLDAMPHNNANPHVAKTVRDICSAQHMQLLPWPAYSPDISPTDYVRDLAGWRLARDPRSAASKDELLLLIQTL
ncbi:uncharacterized protein TNCV_3026661 [Trichonephila clavipes]|nr:uncharacterized protein TNCV_3026661 [Trichonephila clavipes]